MEKEMFNINSHIKIKAAVKTHIGFIRTSNEDNFYFFNNNIDKFNESNYEGTDTSFIFAVCDGMGGESYGEEASKIAVEEIVNVEYKLKHFSGTEIFLDVIKKMINEYIITANDKIYDLELNKGCRIGTTFAGLVIIGNSAISMNIGDSRIYLYRDESLSQLSVDHTEAERMVRLGLTSRDSDIYKRSKHVLTRHLGISPEDGVLEADFSEIIQLKRGDVFVISSDGLTDMVSNDDICSIISNTGDAFQICDNLVKASLDAGGVDNVTVIVVEIM